MQNSPVLQPDRETEFVARLLETAHASGFCLNEIAFVNLYVSLKSKPLMILAGPEGSGKIDAVQCLVYSLLGSYERCQWMVGHPWSFRGSENLAMFSEAHTRYNTEKLLCLIEEALRPENSQRAFFACLNRISPAELLSFFTEISAQLKHGQFTRLGDVYFPEPIRFPSNLFLIGTMDTPAFDWWDHDLLSKTSVIQWPIIGNVDSAPHNGSSGHWESEFLRSCVVRKQAVYHKINFVLKSQKQPLIPLLQVEALLREHTTADLHGLIDEVVRYLANSWSRLGNGLFHPSPVENLKIALDLAIAQMLIPYTMETMRGNRTVRESLIDIVISQFPRSTEAIASMAVQG